MTVKEFYYNIHGDYNDILGRLYTDTLILRFAKRFPSDNTYAELMEAVEKSDISASFEAAHKLKGIAANLSFMELFAALNVLCGQLREQTEPANEELLQKVCESYQLVLREIAFLDDSGCLQ